MNTESLDHLKTAYLLKLALVSDNPTVESALTNLLVATRLSQDVVYDQFNSADDDVLPDFTEDVKLGKLTPTFSTDIKFFPSVRRIYFAGKIQKNCWRNTIVEQCGERHIYSDPYNINKGQTTFDFLYNGRTFVYTGPFFISCDHGCSHVPSAHGAGAGCTEANITRQKAFRNCLNGIDHADTVFVWIGKDFFTAYGTGNEIGYAFAQKKNIILAVHPAMTYMKDHWFVGRMATSVIVAETPKDAFDKYMSYDSPDHLELVKAFLDMPDAFNDWEFTFLKSIMRRHVRLTDKQQIHLDQIMIKAEKYLQPDSV